MRMRWIGVLVVLVALAACASERGDSANVPEPIVCEDVRNETPTATSQVTPTPDPRYPTAARPVPATPEPQREEQEVEAIRTVAVAGDYAYVGHGARLEVFDVSDPAQPARLTRSERLAAAVTNVVLSGSYAYVSAGSYRYAEPGGLYVFDISDPQQPRQVTLLELTGSIIDVVVQDQHAYVTTQHTPPSVQPPTGAFYSIDLAQPAAPQLVGHLPLTEWNAHLVLHDTYAYLGTHAGHLHIVDISDVTRLRPVQRCTFFGFQYAAIVEMVSSDTLLAVSIVDRYLGYKGGHNLTIADITDPTRPRAHALTSGAYTLVAQDEWLYLTDTFPRRAGGYPLVGRFRAVDVSDPFSPTTVAELRLPGYPRAITITDDAAVIGYANGVLGVVDITDVGQPKLQSWLPPPVNPDLPGKIVFEQRNRLKSNLVLSYPDGVGATSLTHMLYGWYIAPAFAPDETRVAVAFNPAHSEQGYLRVIDLRTGGMQTLVEEPGRYTDPAWSPDGRRIAFASSIREGWHLWLVNADGTNLTRLTHEHISPFAPAWSPDGRQIAFHSYRDHNGNIYVMDADGSNPQRLTDHPANDTDPAFSPDGEYIAFQSSRDTPDGCGMNVWVMRADGSDPRNLTGHTDCAPRSGAPTWSPDGTMLAFQQQASRDGEMQIVVLELTRTGDTMQPGAVRVLGPGSFPDWGP